MIHETELLNDASDRRFDWRLTNWSSAVRIALGGRALLAFRLAFAILLAPTVLLAGYALYANRPTLLILVALSGWGFWTSSTRPTGIGMAAGTFTAIAGFVVSVLRQDKLLAFSGVLPGVTWFGSCAILGTTARYILDELRKSEASFQVLVTRGILQAAPVAQRSEAPDPAAGPASNGQSPPPAP